MPFIFNSKEESDFNELVYQVKVWGFISEAVKKD